jgi:hypothetical protein
MGTLGMYKEATDILNKINIATSPELIGYYFTKATFMATCLIMQLRLKKKKKY